jgi:FAD/FMN-containing dehydrogenase
MADQTISRREMLGLLSSGLAVATGFDPTNRRWLSQAEAAGCPTFVDAPALDGVLLLDDGARAADSRDKGNIAFQTPCAVLRPGSVEDIQRMIRYCRRYDLKVATRGQAHTMFGQSLSPGLVIESGSLNRIHSIGPEGADVDAGARWKDLLIASFDHGLTPSVLTGYTNLSIGGTLSVGGMSGRNYAGAQVDHVRELEVVTGVGNVHRCSAENHSDLFEAVLAGLGQCGVMTRATLELVPAKQLARLYNPTYADTATFFQDIRTLANRNELSEVFNIWMPAPDGNGFVAQVQAVQYFNPDSPPDDAHLMRGLSMPPEAVPFRDMTYLEYELNVDVLIDFFQANFGWNDLIKPWYDVWLPESTIEQHVNDVLPTLTPLDVGPFGFLLLFPLHRSGLTRPFFRMPEPDGHPFVYLFDVLTASPSGTTPPTYVTDMLARNRRWFERARALGGTRYPISAIEFTPEDWEQHYGALWTEFRKRKQRFDPDNILAPGLGIFP